METHKNAFLVGLFVLAVILGGLGFTLWLTKTDKGETMHYQVHFTESVSGLKVGSAVKFRGVDVGTIESMSIDHDPKRVRVDINVLKSAPIKTGTTATLKLQGLTGDIYIDLAGGTPSEQDLADASRDAVPEIRSTPSTVNTMLTRLPEILERMDQLFEKANHVAGQIDKVFSDRNVNALNGVVGKLAKHYGPKEPSSTPEPSQPEAPAHRK